MKIRIILVTLVYLLNDTIFFFLARQHYKIKTLKVIRDLLRNSEITFSDFLDGLLEKL